MIKSYNQYINYDTKFKIFENAGIYYLSDILPLDNNIFYCYFYIIKNKKYISDTEFNHLYSFLTYDINVDLLKKKDILSYDLQCPQLKFEKCILIKNNYNNAGHSFGNITYQIYNAYNNIIDIKNYKIIIPEHLLLNNFLKSLIYLFFDNEQVVILKKETLIKCNTLYIFHDNSHKQPEPIMFLIEKLLLTKNKKEDKNDNKNIFIIKSNLTANISTHRVFDNSYNEYFISKGFKQIIPENYDIVELFDIIYNAKNIVMSWGCCCYLNSTFVSKKANILIIGHQGYNHEYRDDVIKNELQNREDIVGFFPGTCNIKLFLGDLTSELTYDNMTLLDSKLCELLSDAY
jgi:hypothetical protein